MNRTPLVSVVVATYRRDKSLRRAIESILEQTYPNIEIVIVDDNDDSEWNSVVSRIIQDYSINYNIKLIQNHPNQGSSKSRNVGICNSTGEYVTFLDDDDLYLANKVEAQLKKMVSDNADYSISDLYLLNENGTLNEIRTRHYLLTEEKNNLLLCHLKYHMTGTDTLMFRRDYLFEIGLFEPIDVGDEFYLMSKAIDSGGTLSYLSEIYVKAFIHTGENGLSSGKSKIDGENLLYNYKKKYFSKISKSDRKYISMRHHAVLAFAYFRMRNYHLLLKEGLLAFLIAPKYCLKLIIGLR